MQGHPNLGCICASRSLAKQTANVFIKYYLQNGDKDLPPHKATCFYTPLVNNSPSSSSILNELCVSPNTQITRANQKKIYFAPENNSIYTKQQRWMFSWCYSTWAGDLGGYSKGHSIQLTCSSAAWKNTVGTQNREHNQKSPIFIFAKTDRM